MATPRFVPPVTDAAPAPWHGLRRHPAGAVGPRPSRAPDVAAAAPGFGLPCPDAGYALFSSPT